MGSLNIDSAGCLVSKRGRGVTLVFGSVFLSFFGLIVLTVLFPVLNSADATAASKIASSIVVSLIRNSLRYNRSVSRERSRYSYSGQEQRYCYRAIWADSAN